MKALLTLCFVKWQKFRRFNFVGPDFVIFVQIKENIETFITGADFFLISRSGQLSCPVKKLTFKQRSYCCFWVLKDDLFGWFNDYGQKLDTSSKISIYWTFLLTEGILSCPMALSGFKFATDLSGGIESNVSFLNDHQLRSLRAFFALLLKLNWFSIIVQFLFEKWVSKLSSCLLFNHFLGGMRTNKPFT